MIIAIAGGSASGKTTVLNRLSQEFSEEVISFISSDNYYKEQSEQHVDENGMVNYDLPSALHSDKLVRDISAIKAGKEVFIEEYTFNNPDVEPKKICYKPTKIVIVEGLFVFHYPQLQELIDYRVLVDAPENIRLERRIKRDAEERGYSKKDVLYQWENHVLPAYSNYLAPYKKQADLIIDSYYTLEQGVEMLISFIGKQLQ